MRNRYLATAVLALLSSGPLWPQQPAEPAQPAQAPAAQTPVQKQPQVKSQAEGQAIMAIFQAQDPDARIKAAQALLEKYADTEFNVVAMQMIAGSYQQKNDFENMVVWGERVLEADPKNYVAMSMLATGLAQRTQEFDLDREEKLGRVEKYARSAIEVVKTAPKPRPDVTEEQWQGVKKDVTAQAHEALAMAAATRKKYDVAIAEFKAAIEGAATPDPVPVLRLGRLYVLAEKYDDAVALLDKVMAGADVQPQIKQIAQADRARALALKAKRTAPTPAGTPPAATTAPPATTTAPPQVEINKP